MNLDLNISNIAVLAVLLIGSFLPVIGNIKKSYEAFIASYALSVLFRLIVVVAGLFLTNYLDVLAGIALMIMVEPIVVLVYSNTQRSNAAV
jgi:hypothetical protein